MFCSECGAKAAGKFCSSCGHRLGTVAPAEKATAIDWSDVVDYEQLLAIPAVRERIARSAASSKKSLTGEEYLDMCGKVLGSAAGIPVSLPMSSIARFAQSTYSKLGVKTGKSRCEFIAQQPGNVLVTILCSLAREGRAIRDVRQLQQSCMIVAALPSDLFALEGELVISVTRHQTGSIVEARTEIAGQVFDWGKSTRCLDRLFAELASSIAA